MRKPRKSQRVIDACKLAKDVGVDLASEKLGLSRETVKRYVREQRQFKGESTEKIYDNIMRQISERFTKKELRSLATGSMVQGKKKRPIQKFTGDEINFGLISDTHLGSIYTDDSRLYSAFDKFAEIGVDFIAHCGDVHEGLSHRAGHVYECSHVGYASQLEHSREVFSQWTDTPIYMVDGNHDRWFIKSAGAFIVEDLCRSQENLICLGHDEGDIKLSGTPTTIKLWHGEDGSSYAISYRIQKLVESFTGGEKPHVLLCGHTHKSMYVFDRHVHCISAGAIQAQSSWMRSKKHANHTGFWNVKMVVDKNGVVLFQPTWYPFYE